MVYEVSVWEFLATVFFILIPRFLHRWNPDGATQVTERLFVEEVGQVDSRECYQRKQKKYKPLLHLYIFF